MGGRFDAAADLICAPGRWGVRPLSAASTRAASAAFIVRTSTSSPRSFRHDVAARPAADHADVDGGAGGVSR